MTPTTKNLLFLLSAAPMGLGGCIVNIDPLTSLGDGDGDGDGDQTSSETGTSSVGDGDGDGAPGDGDGAPGDGDGTPGDGDGDGTPGDGDGAAGDGDGAPGSACADYAALYAMCNDTDYAEELGLCEMYQDYFSALGDACLAAFDEVLVCLSGLTCDDLAMDPPPGCEAQLAAFGMNCNP